MSFIEIKPGAREGSYSGADGVYTVTLLEIGDPRTVVARNGPRAGQEIDLIDWVFAVEQAPTGGQLVTGSTTTASGPQSKMYAWLTALFAGKAPPVGTRLEKSQLVGRRALATLQRDDDGWLRITNLGAIPSEMLERAAVNAAAPPQVAVRPPVVDDLPF